MGHLLDTVSRRVASPDARLQTYVTLTSVLFGDIAGKV